MHEKLTKLGELAEACPGTLYKGIQGFGDTPIADSDGRIQDEPVLIFESREALMAALAILPATSTLLAIIAEQKKALEVFADQDNWGELEGQPMLQGPTPSGIGTMYIAPHAHAQGALAESDRIADQLDPHA